MGEWDLKEDPLSLRGAQRTLQPGELRLQPGSGLCGGRLPRSPHRGAHGASGLQQGGDREGDRRRRRGRREEVEEAVEVVEDKEGEENEFIIS